MAMKASLSFAPPSSSSSPFGVPSRRALVARRTLGTSFFNGGGTIFVPFLTVQSYANALLSSMEDPEKILEQAVLEMTDDLTKMRQATAQVLASQKRLENRYKAAQQASDEWYRKAQLALAKGDEDLAREALKRRKSYAVGTY
ncbi:hypothetical protein BHE74_00023533 [Ensete ventricosum]|uniref:Uncharacterized protein n=1 Tax=Ensete ventricosum TaxID=4639 RepID=A0A444FH01_ENSVE|nr:hypothetical protein GW17_00013897 [Ensete ventricosum]RWW68912.1 hypothetical protein BHE74_00023533 [Ensete ventricosum]RZR73849.1 hypothetical protein BHM03_00028883 [Ensete ventricosum]